MTENTEHAVVVGASVAGLLAAAAVAEHFDQVTVIEREQLPPAGHHRAAVPQGKHVHALLPGGLAAIEQLLPRFEAELVAGGAVRCRSLRQMRLVFSGHELARDAAAATNVLASRPFVEGHLRRRVLQLPNVTLVDGTSVQALVAGPDGTSVTGVRLASRVVAAGLVVVATGRAGQLPAWLAALGFPAPSEDELRVDIWYASRHLRIPDGSLGEDRLILVTPQPGRPRGMGLFAQEDGTWLLTLAGYGAEHRPPSDEGGYASFLASVAPADVLAAVTAGQALDEIAIHGFPASRRRRYERLARFPSGVIAIGDAISSFNPVYGQGMSVAALEAVALRQALAPGTDQLPRRYFRSAGAIVDIAWDLAIGSDLSLPEVPGPRPLVTRLSNAWSERILQAAEHDPYVAEVFGSVTDLLAPPAVLVRPRFAWRVLRRSRAARPAASTRVPVA
jgi:2-polyprenyl-6-methoxyphenol hydroxylase-like FAD-dependent oxidoreductase